jgi:hypothetical protein
VPPLPENEKRGFNTPFFEKQASAWIMSRTTKKNIKASETKAHGNRFTYCFIVRGSF